MFSRANRIFTAQTVSVILPFGKEKPFLKEAMEKNTGIKKMAVELLDKACTHVKGLYSRKKDIKFDADLLLTLEDGKPRFHLEFPKKK